MTTTIAPSSGAGLLFTQQGVGTTPGYSALDLRRSEVVGPVQEGVYAAGDFMVTVRGAGANMSVDIAAGSGAFAAVQGDSVTGQGLYVVGPHSAAAINEAVAAADPTNPRVDIVILEIQDNVHDASGGNLARTRVLAGTPSAGANLTNRTAAPALPANALLLADILVGAAVTTIPNTVIRDRRKWARGGFVRVIKTAGSYTTSSTTLAQLDSSLVPRMECSGLPVRVSLMARVGGAASGTPVIAPRIDLVVADAAADIWTAFGGASSDLSPNMQWVTVPAAGSHTFDVAWRNSTAATITMQATTNAPLVFVVEEIIRQNTANNTTTSG